MPIHIYGSGGGGGGTKNAITTKFSPTNEQSHTFTIDDVDFAKRYNEAQTSKTFELILEGTLTFEEETTKSVVYHCYIGIVGGDNVSQTLVLKDGLYMRGTLAALWDGGFTISDNSASFTVTLINGVTFAASRVHKVTWLYEE